jgi:hypothetical protein
MQMKEHCIDQYDKFLCPLGRGRVVGSSARHASPLLVSANNSSTAPADFAPLLFAPATLWLACDVMAAAQPAETCSETRNVAMTTRASAMQCGCV